MQRSVTYSDKEKSQKSLFVNKVSDVHLVLPFWGYWSLTVKSPEIHMPMASSLKSFRQYLRIISEIPYSKHRSFYGECDKGQFHDV